jgi:predicted DNA-binding protein
MGRPPLNVKPTVVRLSVETLRRIEALVGKNRMAEFIREAVERELKRRERKA